MFIPIPINFRDGRQLNGIPVVNALFVVVNVLAFCLHWHPTVGPGTGLFSILTYAFGHADIWHLAGNMLVLLIFGTPVNRRLGNGWYFLAYVGSAVALGLFARLFCPGPLIGASGAIFAVIAMALMLFPSAIIEIGYFALFPFTLLVGLFDRPRHWVYWFIRWDSFGLRAWWGLFLVPLLEFWGLVWSGWNWTNLGHLLGLLCGLGVVLLLPTRISMNRSTRSVFSGA
ncbi:MAG TPA: rhomboid family intramembrane serine protease [Planctomycetaceae bacterium]|nr:rhomboid family intramembrane serine protease [Planctomycetaceae bacterium]